MPSIIFWDPKYWEINQNTKILFKKLEEERVFHSCPSSAAKHLEEIWEDIDSWWFSSDVQKAVTEFNEVFSKKNPKFLKSIQNSLI